MVRDYSQAYILKRRIENENAWIQGAYMANAMSVCLANSFGKKKIDYLKKPFDLFPKTEAEKAEDIRASRKKVIEWLSKFKKQSKSSEGVDQNGKP